MASTSGRSSRSTLMLDERVVEHPAVAGSSKRLVGHDVAPVAGRVADGEEDRAVLPPGRARTPRRPRGTSRPGCRRAGAGRGWSRRPGGSRTRCYGSTRAMGCVCSADPLATTIGAPPPVAIGSRHRRPSATVVGCRAMDLRLDGKTALVTGASRGIGRAIAPAFAEAGAVGDDLVAQGRRPGRRRRTRSGPPAVTARARWPGTWPTPATPSRPRRAWRPPSSASARSTSWSTTPPPTPTSARSSRSTRAGRTRRCGSTSRATSCGRRRPGAPGWPSTAGSSSTWPRSAGCRWKAGIGWYNVTKAAVIHLTRQLAGELGPRVRVNALAPGLVKTDFARALWEPGEEADRPPAAAAPPGRARRHRQRRPVPVLGCRLVDHRPHPGGRRRRAVHRQRRAVEPSEADTAPGQRGRAHLAARGAGQGATTTSSRGAAHGGEPAGHQVAELVQRRAARPGRPARPRPPPVRPTRGRAASTPPPRPRPGGGQHVLDGSGPDLLASGDDDVGHPAEDRQRRRRARAGRRRRSGTSRPARRGIGAVAVAPQEHRAAHQDLALVARTVAVAQADLDPVEGPSVVDDARAGLGHGRRWSPRWRGEPGRAARPRRAAPPGSPRRRRGRRAVATSETRVAPEPGRRARRRRRRSPSSTVHGVPVSSARVTTERPPMWASGRQASHRSAAGSTPRRAEVARAEAAHGVVGEHHPLGLRRWCRWWRRPGRRRLGRPAPGPGVARPRPSTTRRAAARRAAWTPAGAGRPGVDRQHRVPVLPDGAQRIDEPRAGGQVERYAARGMGVA